MQEWRKVETYIYGHLGYNKAAAFFNAFQSYNLTPDNHANDNPICVHSKL